MTQRNVVEKTKYPRHLFQKRLAIRRLDTNWVRPHQPVKCLNRLAIQAGATFIQTGINGQRQIASRQYDLGGLTGARELRGKSMAETDAT
jgi:hypothetical protein